MLTILPLASSLNPPDQVRDTVSRLSRRLADAGVPHDMVAPGFESPSALLVVTGGTEHLALAALDGRAGPAVLIAHPEQNSLPAALEILSRLRQTGRRGRVALLNRSAEGCQLLARLAAIDQVHRRLAAMRLGLVGRPSDWLVASMPAPEVITEVWGPQVIDIPIAAVRAAMAAADPAAIAGVVSDFVGRADRVAEPTPDDLTAAGRVAVALRAVVAAHRLDACAVRCFDLVVDEGTTGCLALSWLLDQGIVAGCEGDLPATVTMAWLHAMTGEAGFMANPQDVDPASGQVLLAHCTIARRMVARYTLRSHFESSLGVAVQGSLDPGPVTLARIGGADMRDLFAADGELVACEDHARRCRTQLDVRLSSDAGELLEKPAGNHHVLVRGHWADRLREYHGLYVAREPRPEI